MKLKTIYIILLFLSIASSLVNLVIMLIYWKEYWILKLVWTFLLIGAFIAYLLMQRSKNRMRDLIEKAYK